MRAAFVSRFSKSEASRSELLDPSGPAEMIQMSSLAGKGARVSFYLGFRRLHVGNPHAKPTRHAGTPDYD